MDSRFEYITNLQYKVKALTARLAVFESGEKYVTMKSEHTKQLDAKNEEIRKLRFELANANSRTITVRNNWQQVIEDLEKEHAKALLKKDRETDKAEARALSAERRLDEKTDKLTEKNRELYQVKVELEDEKGENLKLMSQLNRDFENSSIPSSMKLNRKKIVNSREKTGNRPGGHNGHGRNRHSPTNRIFIPAPQKFAGSPEYKLTGKVITKQVVNLSVSVIVDEYSTPEFRNIRTGQHVHADFPEGVMNEVNYGGSVKAFAFLLNNHCCVSIDKVREFLSELTGGRLQISKGMINGLSEKLSEKTEKEQKKAFSDLLLSPAMNVDFTNSRVDGKSVQVAVCATPDTVMYFARGHKGHKGHKGVKGTPAEDYQGILIHGHDKTFYSYGNAHQECLAHVIRYLKDSIDNEPNLKWSSLMRDLIREMIHYRNSLEENEKPCPCKVGKYETRYQKILEVAKYEYEYEPPGDYYKDGYNLYRRLSKYKDSHLLFLHDKRIPTNNNLSERLLRVLKRKQKQVMTFRRFESLDYLCNGMSMIASWRNQGLNLYESATSVFR